VLCCLEAEILEAEILDVEQLNPEKVYGKLLIEDP
jgi:hypothetical protein